MSTTNTLPRDPTSIAYGTGSEGEGTFPPGEYYNFGTCYPSANIQHNTETYLGSSHEDFGYSTITPDPSTSQTLPHFGMMGPTATPDFDSRGSSAANLAEPTTLEPVTQGRYTCDVPGCLKTFGREYDIKRHKRNKHPAPGDPQYFCEFAGEDGCDRHNRPFSRPDKRKNHYESIHRGRYFPIIEDEDSIRSTEVVAGRVKVSNATTVDPRRNANRRPRPIRQKIHRRSNASGTRAAPPLRPATDSFAYKPPATVPVGISPSQPALSATPRERQQDYSYVAESAELGTAASATVSSSPRRQGRVGYQKATGWQQQQQQQPLFAGPLYPTHAQAFDDSFGLTQHSVNQHHQQHAGPNLQRPNVSLRMSRRPSCPEGQAVAVGEQSYTRQHRPGQKSLPNLPHRPSFMQPLQQPEGQAQTYGALCDDPARRQIRHEQRLSLSLQDCSISSRAPPEQLAYSNAYPNQRGNTMSQ